MGDVVSTPASAEATTAPHQEPVEAIIAASFASSMRTNCPTFRLLALVLSWCLALMVPASLAAAEGAAAPAGLTVEESRKVEAAKAAVKKTPEMKAATAKFNAARKAYQLDRAKFPAERNQEVAVRLSQGHEGIRGSHAQGDARARPALAALLEKADAAAKSRAQDE